MITPWQKTVEAIAKRIGGPADGNLVEHVRAICDGAARLKEERDSALLSAESEHRLVEKLEKERDALVARAIAAETAPSPHTTGEERIRELSTDLDDALTAMSEAGTSAGWPEADLRKLLADIDGQYRRLYVRATKRDQSPAPSSSGTPEHRVGWLAERLARAVLNGNGDAARDLAEVLLYGPVSPATPTTEHTEDGEIGEWRPGLSDAPEGGTK